MAKSPKPGKCVHCLRHPVQRNWDHVFPDSWYPDTTPKNLARWQIPSCYKCNRELGAIESEFFVRIALCLNPNDPASRSIVEKALRAMKPTLGKSPADKRAREALGRKVTGEMLKGEQIPSQGAYPSLGARWGRPQGSGIALIIPIESFRRITEKIVRGITYFETKRYIEPPHHVQFYALDDKDAAPIRNVLTDGGTTLAREPGIVVKRVVAPDDGVSAMYELEFWKQFKTYAAVLEDA